MSRFLLILCILLFANTAYAVEFAPLEAPKQEKVKAETEVPKGLLNDENYKFKGRVEYNPHGTLFLDEDETLKVKIDKPKKFASKSVLKEKDLFSIIEQEKHYITPKVDEYLIEPSFGTLECKINDNFKFGTTFGTDLDNAQLEYRTKMFARYDNRFIGLTTALGKDAYTSSGRQMGSVYLTPEIKLGKGFVLIDSFKANPSYERHKNEIILQYSPKIHNTRENLSFEAGMGQTTYYKTGNQYYQFSFSTKFKF